MCAFYYCTHHGYLVGNPVVGALVSSNIKMKRETSIGKRGRKKLLDFICYINICNFDYIVKLIATVAKVTNICTPHLKLSYSCLIRLSRTFCLDNTKGRSYLIFDHSIFSLLHCFCVVPPSDCIQVGFTFIRTEVAQHPFREAI